MLHLFEKGTSWVTKVINPVHTCLMFSSCSILSTQSFHTNNDTISCFLFKWIDGDPVHTCQLFLLLHTEFSWLVIVSHHGRGWPSINFDDIPFCPKQQGHGWTVYVLQLFHWRVSWLPPGKDWTYSHNLAAALTWQETSGCWSQWERRWLGMGIQDIFCQAISWIGSWYRSQRCFDMCLVERTQEDLAPLGPPPHGACQRFFPASVNVTSWPAICCWNCSMGQIKLFTW